MANGGGAAVSKIPAGGGAPVVIGSGFNNPFGVAVDASGNVFVADSGNGLVKEVPAGGGAPVTLGSGFVVPFGIATDGAGNVYVGDQSSDNIKEITPVGGYYIGPFLPAGLSFNNSTGIISGTPTANGPATNYTVTAYNNSGNGSAAVSIKVLPSANSSLSAIGLSNGTLSPKFAAATTGYTATVGNAITTLTVTPTAGNVNATIKVNGSAVTSGSASGPVSLNVGPNNIAIVVSAAGGTPTATYTITVTRAPSNNANLSTLGQ